MQLIQHHNTSLLLAQDSPADASWFDRRALVEAGRVEGHSDGSGRHPAWFLNVDGYHCVLRHYYRGGLPGKLIKDLYLWPGLHNTRAYQELALLERLVSLGLPVSRPVAAQVVRSGPLYRADLLTERLDGCRDLVKTLVDGPLPEEKWRQLGALLARFHKVGVYHADLNARNILMDEERFYLIDFDRGEIRPVDPAWQQANLDRLLRSFRKESDRVAGLHWRESDWQSLLAGYLG
ncbi:3-deoxy-D-manno-octulosonic acid kinase [Ferrimonas sediminicola]|uniref:3-deoxy-D-manno-octulosonic acid kinase n=1 Tax=Ferrimonas sediminicola TaxID=2569538 RepID=A0A4U1BAN6_9GAMM|nr:3-deoxy-D-manno-octulosonic acid kinase [Ferrimonas sediminicola]TKB47595.1 3-deoxy-D-manno-octulosonic acid kinase [Ferrimonas sediminicola]